MRTKESSKTPSSVKNLEDQIKKKLVVCFTESYSIHFHESLYGEVNSVKKHNYKIWLNDGVY